MTPTASESQSFSAQLKAHAACMDLSERGGVGDWTFGQGLRRAHGSTFFYELRAQGYLPFGVNHPLALRARFMPATEQLAVHEFPQFLIARYPALADRRWAVMPNSTAPGPLEELHEDATLKTRAGWMGFDHFQQLPTWTVEWTPGILWVCSAQPLQLPAESTELLEAQALARLFLSNDVLGETGRLRQWTGSLSASHTWGRWEGLNFYFTPKGPDAAATLLAQGIAVDTVGNELRACFALSMLDTDVQDIMQALRAQQG